MPTILHLTTVHPRFDTRVFIKEAQTLAASLPHEVMLMVADGQGSVSEPLGRVSVHDLGPFTRGRIHRALAGSWRAFSAIRRLKPRVVHFHDPELVPLGILLGMTGCKVVYDVHEDVPLQVHSKHYLPWLVRYPIAWLVSLVEWVGAKAFSAIVPATPNIAERFPASKTVTVHNFPIIKELLQGSPSPYAGRPQAFVYTGAIASIRGIAELIRAASNIPGAMLDLAGPVSPPGYLDELRRLPGWIAVKYHGEVSRKQIAELLGGARAGLVVHHPIPNEIDALPIKMFEYMSTGLPLIASDFPVLRRVIDGAKCGLLVDPLDPKAIENAMRWILEHPAKAEEMGRRGRQAVERIYNWEAEAAKLVGLYKRLLDLPVMGMPKA